jgi:hypothetical protein
MTSRWFLSVTVVVLVLVALPHAYGQVTAASLSGTVTDESKAVLPGVTVTATDLATGRNYLAVTDAQGNYRLINLAPSTYKLTAELAGFATIEIPKLELLVGQSPTLPFTMKVATVRETVTVTSETPLVNTQSSQVAGNVDRRQMEQLPLQGRNWIELSMLVKGITANNVTETPGESSQNQFQLNVDGQQVTNKLGEAGFGQPRFSRESIAEFQLATNQFDVTQGRSLGVELQAITRTGTNTLAGSVFGNFRSDRLNAADPVAHKVLPYSDQQTGGSIGGPIVRDKLHFFGTFEYERNPFTIFSQPTYLPGETFTLPSKSTTRIYLARVDYQMSGKDHLSVRWGRSNWANPFGGMSGTSHPSQAQPQTMDSTNILATWSRIFTNNLVSEFRVGYNGFAFWNGVPDGLYGTPQYEFPGLTIGARYSNINASYQRTYQFRYDITWLRANHTIKVGGEFLRDHDNGVWELYKAGRFVFNTRPPDLTRRFPADAWNDPSRWDLTGLNAYVQKFDQNYDSGNFLFDVPRPTLALWFGDTWRVRDPLTINAGVRWDADWGVFSPPGLPNSQISINNGFQQGDFGAKSGIQDLNNVAPRVGLTYKVGGRNDLVIRGGSGLFYASPTTNFPQMFQIYGRMVAASFSYDGKPDFVLDPTRGVTAQDYLSGKVAAPPQSLRILGPNAKMPFTWQNTVGFQKQLGPVMAFDSDLTHYIWYNDIRTYDPNLWYDPTTGYNKNPTTAGRPNPAYGQLTYMTTNGRKDQLQLASSFTRRLKDKLQAGVTYTLMFYMHDDGSVGFTGGPANNNFCYVTCEWATSTDFQRNTVRAYTLYELPWGFSLSGTYSYGSGNRFSASLSSRPYGKLGTNRLNIGAPITVATSGLVQFDGPAVVGTGEVIPRNAFEGLPLQRVDVRLAKTFRLVGNVKISGFLEVFNLLNHANYGSYDTVVDSLTFGQPRAATGDSYAPRIGQLAFRLTF